MHVFNVDTCLWRMALLLEDVHVLIEILRGDLWHSSSVGVSGGDSAASGDISGGSRATEGAARGERHLRHSPASLRVPGTNGNA